MRVGHGYDVHQLANNRKLILGGVEIAHSKGLLGHSDADVVLHAICDAVLGALGLGDIGQHFPDSDAQYAGIDSRKLLRKVHNLMHERGFVMGNLDVTIAAQAPRLASHLAAMQENIAADLQCHSTQINLKATTTEGLGFVGREEGIAAHAVTLIIPADNPS